MKIYSVECISGKTMGPCGIFSTMNLAISMIICRNSFRTDTPSILTNDSEASVIYEGNDDYNYTEYHIAEQVLDRWIGEV